MGKLQRSGRRVTPESISRVESDLEILREGSPSPWYSYDVARAFAQLSTVVGRLGTGTKPSPAERAMIQDYQDRAMDALRGALAEDKRFRVEFRTDHDLDSLRERPDFQALLSDLAFPDDPFDGAYAAH